MSWVIIEHDGQRRRIARVVTPRGTWLGWPGGAILRQREAVYSSQAGGDDRLVAPMTGRVVAIQVKVGDHVAENAPLVVLEAMKMEYRLTAPHPGRVSAVGCRVGELVDLGATLVELDGA